MRRSVIKTGALVVTTLALAVATGCGGDDGNGNGNGNGETAEEGPITIGAAVDQTDLMQFFDGPALAAAEIQADQINEEGGVDGREIQFLVEDTRLEPARTRSVATDMVNEGADVLWVTCDVDWATPSTQVGLAEGLLTVAPCIGTDQMGPLRFGEDGQLAYSFGNVAQDEGAALAALAEEEGWTTANVATDESIAYTQNVCEAFKNRFQENGGEIVADETFTEGDGTVGAVVNRVNAADADTILICATTQEDLPAFVSGVRGGGNQTPIMGPWSIDGAFWLPNDPQVANNIYVLTYASVYGDDPTPEVQDLIEEMEERTGEPPATGGFVTGAGAVEAIAEAIEMNDGSTDGEALASTLEEFDGVETVSGSISFSPELHSVFGREYRLIEIMNGEPSFVRLVEAGEPAELGG